MHIISVGFVFAGVNIALQGVFQGLEAGNASLIVSLLRLLIIPLPLAWLFSHSALATTAVFWAFPIGEAAAAAVALLLLKWTFSPRVAPISNPAKPRTKNKI